MERFSKVKNIGKGNMGTCALVRNNEDGRHYVIKQVDLAKLNKKERAQSLNEAKVLSVLRHPNVINYNDSFLARKTDHLCIVMEYADGGDLGQKIKSAHGVNFGEDQVIDWMIQTVLALIHIHSRHILHRDIKTANVFLTSDGLCKIGDFGIAKALENTVDSAKTFVGTPYYLSPELILEKPYDYLSDVWAFGVCLYETMALKHPFNAGDMKGLMQKILRVQYDPLPNCYSPELRNLVSRILVKEASQRIKLQDILKLPFVVNRIKKWLGGGVLPPRYIAALVRFKLLPPGLAEAAGHHQNPGNSMSLPAINLAKNKSGMNNNTGGRESSSGYHENSFVSNVPSSSHSQQAGGAPPFTSRPPASYHVHNQFGNNNMNNANIAKASAANAQPKLNLPPLGPLGGGGGGGGAPLGNNNQPPRKGSFSFPAPPNLPRQHQHAPSGLGGGGGGNNQYQHHNQFGAGAGLIRNASGMPHNNNNNNAVAHTARVGNNNNNNNNGKLPSLPALPPLGRPQPGSL